MPDQLDDFLDRGFSCDPKGELKDAVREQTSRVIRRRRRVRHLAFVGMAAACYLAGLGTMWLLVPRATATVDAPVPTVVAMNKVDAPASPKEKPPEQPEIYELDAQTAPPAERAIQLRKAGDLYLEKQHDYAGALRCYTQAFNTAGAQALEISPDDNWLVIAIKNSRRMEKINEKSY